MEILIVGIISLTIGGALRYWVNRRRFNRRNPAGLQQFRNYELAWSVTLLERLGKLIGLILFLFGLLLIWMYYSDQKKRSDAQDRKNATEELK